MESFNFGAFDPTIGARIAAIPQEAQKQQTANMLQAMQMQGAMRQNEMSQMQLDEMKTDRAEMVKLQQDLAAKGGSPDLGQYADMLMRSPKHMKLGIELKQKLAEQAQFARIMGDAPAAAPEPGAFGAGAAAVPAQAQNNALAPAAPPVNAFAAGGDEVAALQRKRNALLSLGTPQGIAAARALDADIALVAKGPTYQNVSGVGLVEPRTGRVVVPSVEPTDPVIKQYNLAVSQGFKGSILDYKREIANAGRARAAPRAESPTEKVIDPATGKQIIVSREEAISRRMTPAAAGESLPPKEIQKREAALPAATSAVTGFEKKSDNFIKDLIALRDDPGLDQITGSLYGRTGSVSRAGSRAQALYDKITAKGGFQALQDLRDASKTGGALGNVSNQEGKQLTASFAAIDRRQDARDVQAAINQAIADIEGARTRTREAYDSTYSYKSPGGNTPTAPASNIDALLNKYK